MNKELCFILDNKNIYLDHILVDYEYVPIFFLCKDDECQYYLALFTDIENGIRKTIEWHLNGDKY